MSLFNQEQVKQRFQQYWKLENETALTSIKVLKDPSGYNQYIEKISHDKRFHSAFHRKADPHFAINHQAEVLKYMAYLGDSTPVISSDIGPAIGSAFLGTIVDLGTPETPTWFYKNHENYYDSVIEFNENNIWWNIQKLLTEQAFIKAKDAGSFAAIPADLHNGIDTLMMIRGSENLSIDLIMEPDSVKEECKKIMDYWFKWMDKLFEICHAHADGNGSSWLNFWGPGKTHVMQSDFMTMISAEMYEEFILPDVIAQAQYLDYSIFHFDGPDEIIRHLDFLLNVQELNGIQWNPATNCENVRHIPTLKRIQQAGKCLVLNIAAHEIEPLLNELSPKGLLLNIDPFIDPYTDVTEAQELINKVNKYKA